MCDDEEAYQFWAETEVSDLAYEILETCRQDGTGLLEKGNSCDLTRLLLNYLVLPNPFEELTDDKPTDDDFEIDGDG